MYMLTDTHDISIKSDMKRYYQPKYGTNYNEYQTFILVELFV